MATAEKTVAWLLLMLADPKTKKPSNFNEWLRRLRGDARNILWLHGDFALLENNELHEDHTLVKKLRYINQLLATPSVQENIQQSYKFQLNKNEVLAQIAARREEVWAFVTVRVSLPSMEKLDRSHLEELLELRSTHDVPGLIKLLCTTHMLKHAHSAGQNRMDIMRNLMTFQQAFDEDINAYCIRLEDEINLYVWQLPSDARTRYLEADDTILMVRSSFNVKMTKWKSEVTASPLVPANAATYIQHAIN